MDEQQARERAAAIRLLLTDVDGVLTDNGVYYSDNGEAMKRFSIRDGMGVERLRNLSRIVTGIITGETSPSVVRRAEKLGIQELHLGVKDKLGRVSEILERNGLQWSELAFIGDDVNDLAVLEKAGFSGSPCGCDGPCKRGGALYLRAKRGRRGFQGVCRAADHITVVTNLNNLSLLNW